MVDWDGIARAAAEDAGLGGKALGTGEGSAIDGSGLLGDFLPRLAEACATGSRLGRADLTRFRAAGARAADQGTGFPTLIDLYLSAAWRAWRYLPSVASEDPEAVRLAGEIVLHAVDDTIVAVGDGFSAARRATVRLEASSRREFVDDLLAGTADPVDMLPRGEAFGLDLAAAHAVAVVRDPRPIGEFSPRVSRAASALATAGTRDFLVTTRHGLLVAVLPADGRVEALPRSDGARVGLGRVQPGMAGVARSYGEALDALDLADRIGLPDPIVRAEQLLVYRVLLRDREAINELIEAVLAPLRAARGGAEPLLATIEAYLDGGGNTTAAARRLHLSVRAVTYRLRRIHDLTGRDPTRAEDRFVLQAAVLGARALGWPGHSGRVEVDLAGIRQR